MLHKTLLKLVFTILLTVAGFETTFAQKEYIYHFDTFKTIQSSAFYSKVKVIDNRVEKANIGYIQTQKAFSKIEQFDLVTLEPLENELGRYIEQLLPTSNNSGKGDRELLLVVYGFNAENRITRSTFYLKFDAFASINGTYKMIAAIDTIFERKHDRPDPEMKLLFNENMFNLISHILSINPNAIQEEKTFTLAEAKERIAGIKRTYPVYNHPANDGLYKSYVEFLQNKPEALVIKKVEKVIITESLTHYYVYVDSDNRRKGKRMDAEDYFAVHYKDTWYISDGKKFNVMTFENNDFYTQAWMKAAYSVIYRYTAVGGLLTVWTAPEKEEKSWGTYNLRLDVDNGKLMPVKRIK